MACRFFLYTTLTNRLLSCFAMSEPEVPFYVVGALVTLYIVAATWRSRDAACHPADERERPFEHGPTVDRRLVHWWRALHRGRSPK
jgi:hypothetical protein